MLLQATMGMSVDGRMRQVRFAHGTLPHCLDWLQIDNLSVDDASVDLRIERHGHDLGVAVTRRSGDVEVVVLK